MPRGLREAAFGLGATKFEVSTRVVLPAALSGVFASFILAVSRAVGETMAVVLAAGMRPQITLNPLTQIETMTTYIVQVIGGDAAFGEPKYLSLFAVGLTPLCDHAHAQYHLRLGPAALSRGLSMSTAPQGHFHADRLMRRLLGPMFGTACLLATCTGVAVLAVLLGSIVAAALRGRPNNPWYAVGANLAELGGLVRRLATSSQSTRPGAGRLPGRDRREPVASGPGRVDRNPGGRGRRACYLEEYAPPGPAAAHHSDQHRQPGRRALDRLRHSRAWRCFVRAFGFKAIALGPTLLAGVLTLSLLDPADHRDHHAGGAAGGARLAAPGGPGAGSDAMAGGARSRSSVGVAGHLDRHDPGPVARNRRDGPAA